MAKRSAIRIKKVLDQHHEPEIKIKFVDAKGNNIQIVSRFPYEVRENESGSWIAYAPHFKTFGYSNKSESQATEDLKLAINTFFHVHIDSGTLEKALLRFGWFKASNIFQEPKLFNTPVRKNASRRTLSLRVEGERVAVAI
jgi:hypothetical protein